MNHNFFKRINVIKHTILRVFKLYLNKLKAFLKLIYKKYQIFLLYLKFLNFEKKFEFLKKKFSSRNRYFLEPLIKIRKFLKQILAIQNEVKRNISR